uniref:lipoprotein insertase outer membrane protein LolB n=1 Tax=Ralstonia pseudosolanacearum TaxID=1310165 RepID=UPI0032216177
MSSSVSARISLPMYCIWRRLPTPARVARDAQSRPETIEQNGWTVHYVAWSDDGDNSTANARVRRLDLDRPQGAGGTPGPLSVRLVLDQ